MKKSIALFAASLLLLSACTSPFSREGSETPEDGSEQDTVDSTDSSSTENAEVSAAKKEKSCEDSGGDFKNGTCTCPDDTYSNQNLLIYTYDEATGYCVDPDGAPGGILGKDGKGADL